MDPVDGRIPIFVANAEISIAQTGPESALPTTVDFSSLSPKAADEAMNAQSDQLASAGISDVDVREDKETGIRRLFLKSR